MPAGGCGWALPVTRWQCSTTGCSPRHGRANRWTWATSRRCSRTRRACGWAASAVWRGWPKAGCTMCCRRCAKTCVGSAASWPMLQAACGSTVHVAWCTCATATSPACSTRRAPRVTSASTRWMRCPASPPSSGHCPPLRGPRMGACGFPRPAAWCRWIRRRSCATPWHRRWRSCRWRWMGPTYRSMQAPSSCRRERRTCASASPH